jgi:hypothetical protein
MPDSKASPDGKSLRINLSSINWEARGGLAEVSLRHQGGLLFSDPAGLRELEI